MADDVAAARWRCRNPDAAQHFKGGYRRLKGAPDFQATL
jgi:hypothetical protein